MSSTVLLHFFLNADFCISTTCTNVFVSVCVYNVCILFVWGFLLYFSYFLFLVAENKPERTWHICSIFCWWEESGRLENITNLVMWHHPATCLALYIAESKRKTQQYALIFYVFALVYNFVIGMALTIIWHTFQDEKKCQWGAVFLSCIHQRYLYIK